MNKLRLKRSLLATGVDNIPEGLDIVWEGGTRPLTLALSLSVDGAAGGTQCKAEACGELKTPPATGK